MSNNNDFISERLNGEILKHTTDKEHLQCLKQFIIQHGDVVNAKGQNITDEEQKQWNLSRHIEIKKNIQDRIQRYIHPVDEFIFRHQLNIKFNPDKKHTHVAFDGGTYFVPDHLFEEWISVLALHYQSGTGFTKIGEIANPQRVRFFIDCDLKLKQKQALSTEFIQKYVSVIQKCVSLFFPKGNHQVVVSYAFDETFVENKKENGECHGYYKHGLHLTFPQVIVTLIHCRIMVSLIQYVLKEKFDTNTEFKYLCVNSIEDQVDLSVYRINAGGLRMIYQSKMQTCSSCTSVNQLEFKTNPILQKICSRCECTGKLELGRVYRPILVMDEQGVVNENILRLYECDTKFAMLQTCVRVSSDTPIREDFIAVNHPVFPLKDVDPSDVDACGICIGEESERRQNMVHLPQGLITLKVETDNMNNNNNTILRNKSNNASVISSSTKVALNANQIALVTSKIREFCAEWKYVNIHTALYRKFNNYTSIVVNPHHTKSAQYCHNKKNYHKSNFIWWFISSNGRIYQRCWSAKYGCSECKILVASLSMQETEDLFGEDATTPTHFVKNNHYDMRSELMNSKTVYDYRLKLVKNFAKKQRKARICAAAKRFHFTLSSECQQQTNEEEAEAEHSDDDVSSN